MSIPILRPDQRALKQAVYDGWAAGARNVLMQLATGGGKTVIFCDIVRERREPTVIIAHRSEIVGQIAMALARYAVRHRVIAADATIRGIQQSQISEFGLPWTSPHSEVIVASVDTLIRMSDAPWMHRIKLVVQDEAHHVLRDNKWGTAAAMFPNAYGLYPTATPGRADRKGLGRHAHGIVDLMVQGKTSRDLMRDGALCNYVVFCPETDVDYSEVNVTSTGDLSLPKLRAAVHKSNRIVGDVVQSYKKFANGKLCITFCVDVEACNEQVQAYRAAGISAELITSDTPDVVRTNIMRRFRNREILQLVNVDILGEGVDVPAVEAVVMARRTCSLPLYRQQGGRMLRTMPGKERGVLIDLVGNFMFHGPLQKDIEWTLNSIEGQTRSKSQSDIQYRICLNCTQPYEAFMDACPYCSTPRPPPGRRGTPEQVEGNLIELDPSVIDAMCGEIRRIDGDCLIPRGMDNPVAIAGIRKQHWIRQQGQVELRRMIAIWAGYQRHLGRSDSEGYRIFYRYFGLDVLTAQTLGSREAGELTERIKKELDGSVNFE